MQSTTRLHDGVAHAILQEAYLFFHDPSAFHPANGLFNTDSNEQLGARLVAFSGGVRSPPGGFFLRLDDGDPVQEKTLEAHIL